MHHRAFSSRRELGLLFPSVLQAASFMLRVGLVNGAVYEYSITGALETLHCCTSAAAL